MMARFILLLFFGVLLFSCDSKKSCEFETVADFEKIELSKCRADSMFYYLRKFTIVFNDNRKKLGIPLLSPDMRVITYTVDNQARFADIKAMDDTVNRKPYLHHKSIEWDRDTLKYELTSYTANDSLEQFTGMTYWLDTLSAKRDYKYSYFYLNKYYRGDSSMTINRQQLDSILHSWGVSY